MGRHINTVGQASREDLEEEERERKSSKASFCTLSADSAIHPGTITCRGMGVGGLIVPGEVCQSLQGPALSKEIHFNKT